MEHIEYVKIDRKLRKFILSIDTSSSLHANGDVTLVQSIIKGQSKLIQNPEKPKDRKEEILLKYLYIFKYEWHVMYGLSQYGVGDLVLTDGNDNYLVMEVKRLSPFSGKNQCVSRRKTRRKVEEQTQFYMSEFRKLYPKAKSIIGIAVASDEWKIYSEKD